MTCCGANAATDNAQCNAEAAQVKLQDEALLLASHKLEDGSLQTEFVVPGMHCVACIGTLERGLSKLNQVQNVRANLSNKTVSVVWHPDKGKATQLGETIDALGFDYTLREDEESDSKHIAATGKKLLLSLAVAGFAAANIMLLSVSVWSGAEAETAQLFHLISGLIALPAIAYAGQPFFGSAIKALSAKRLNMDVPISLAIILALGMSLYESLTGGAEAYFDAAVTLTFFLLIGRYLDHLMREKARGAVHRLAHLTARGATALEEDGSTRYVALADIEEGMVLRIAAGERLPVNARVLTGNSDIDRSLITGESASLSCGAGDVLEAGILNQTGSLEVVATSNAQNSYLSEIVKMMQAAENGRGRYVRIADRAAQIYAPAVHLIALLTFIGWMFYTNGDWHTSIYTAIAVLIITCPCALGLAVPVVHVIGANRLFKQGVMIRDGSGFERLAEIDHVVFDKTGTLTMGMPVVSGMHNVASKDQPLIKALALRSTHPSAKAIATSLEGIGEKTLSDVTEVPGFGLETVFADKKVRFGRASWVSEITGVDDTDNEQSSVTFAIEGEAPAVFLLEDRLRPQAGELVETFRKEGLTQEIISGDTPRVVAQIANQLGINAFKAAASPADKIRRVDQLRSDGKMVLMVGDGLNDAPALAAAHVSVAPSSASDVGRMASDFVFTRPGLSSVTDAWQVACATGRLVRQNFGIAIAYNCIAVPLAMAGMVTPLIAAIAMSASSIAVISNSMRLNWLDLSDRKADRSVVVNQSPRSSSLHTTQPSHGSVS